MQGERISVIPAWKLGSDEAWVIYSCSSTPQDSAKLMETGFNEAERSITSVNTFSNGISWQRYRSMIVSELQTRELDLAISF